MEAIPPSSTWKNKVLQLAKVAVLGFAVWYIYYRLSHNEQFDENFRQLFAERLAFPHFYWLLGCLLLMPVNWLIEARKWQLLIRPIEPMRLWDALKSVLTGLVIGFISEQHLGSFLGRVWQIGSKDRFKAVGASLLAGICQNYVTWLAGTYGFFFVLIEVFQPSRLVLSWLMPADALILLMITGIIFYSKILVRPVQRIRWLYPYVKIISEYSRPFVLHLTGLSLVRFSIYTFQFVLLLRFFGSDLAIAAAVAAVALMYMAKGILPSFSFLSELGIREFTALYFFGLLEVPESVIIASTMALWLINVLTPAIFGLYFAWNLKVLQQLGRSRTSKPTAAADR